VKRAKSRPKHRWVETPENWFFDLHSDPIMACIALKVDQPKLVVGMSGKFSARDLMVAACSRP
jgi:hypothetical protein